MFGIFGVTKDANKAHGFLQNFASYATDSIGIFGFDKGTDLIASSEWIAAPQMESERGFKFIHFKLCVPFETFYGTFDNETSFSSEPDTNSGKVTVWGNDNFLGFRLTAYSEKDLVQVSANNPPQAKATARACMLMARFKSKGATDIFDFLAGRF